MNQTRMTLKTDEEEEKFPNFVSALNHVMTLSADEVAKTRVDGFLRQVFNASYNNGDLDENNVSDS